MSNTSLFFVTVQLQRNGWI